MIHASFTFLKRIILLKLLKISLSIGGFSVLGSCLGFFDEEGIPKELQEHHPFLIQ